MTLIESVMDNSFFGKINAGIGFLLLIIFVIYFFSKEGKDERGRQHVAIAALISFFTMFVIINLLPIYLPWLIENQTRMLNGIQVLYNVFLLIGNLSWMIIRKIR